MILYCHLLDQPEEQLHKSRHLVSGTKATNSITLLTPLLGNQHSNPNQDCSNQELDLEDVSKSKEEEAVIDDEQQDEQTRVVGVSNDSELQQMTNETRGTIDSNKQQGLKTNESIFQHYSHAFKNDNQESSDGDSNTCCVRPSNVQFTWVAVLVMMFIALMCILAFIFFNTLNVRPDINSIPEYDILIQLKIPDEISTNFHDFGTHLLRDTTGSRVENIEYDQKAVVKINQKILQEWLKGGGRTPVSWTTLIQVVRQLGLHLLAEKIEAHLGVHVHQQKDGHGIEEL